ncbi:EthD family reductase [Nocardia sp. NPDC051030]|uniref:EthD family reductase n=1 Tax=Nocardia sp. NPDC051030 TaxID=3155162 RepID=UPI00342723A7
MYRLTVLYPQPADPAAFRSYYESVHLPLTAKLPGLQSMRHSLNIAAAQGDSPYFAIWEGEFDSAEAMAAAMASEEGQALIADLPNYATGGAEIIHYEPLEDA